MAAPGDFTGFTVDSAAPVSEPAVEVNVGIDTDISGVAPSSDSVVAAAAAGLSSSSPFVPAVLTPAPTGTAASPTALSAVVAAAHGEGKAKLNDETVIPLTFGELWNTIDLGKPLYDVLIEIGAEDSTEMADIACIAEKVWSETLTKLETDGVITSALQRARAVRSIRTLLARLGVAPPALGAPLAPASSTSSSSSGGPPTTRPPAPTASQALLPAPTPVVEDVLMLNFRQYLDQSLPGTCTRLPQELLLAARAQYELKVDHASPDACTPTVEQLSCLYAVLRSGRVPFADFGVFNVYGPRLARFQDTDAQAMVGGHLISKRLAAPASLEGWLACWDLFTVAMVSLGAASVGALKAYADGLKDLATLFPSRWPILISTDLVVRTERWSSLKERFDRTPPPGYNPARPWSHIISMSAYGSEDQKVQTWWNKMVVLPATTTGSVNHTAAVVNAMEGAAVPHGSSAFPVRSDRDPGHRRRSRTPLRREKPKKKEICADFNLKRGSCTGRGTCHAGRWHECPVCGSNHRGCDHHELWEVYAAMGKGKGKGKKGKKGDGKKGGDKDKKD